MSLILNLLFMMLLTFEVSHQCYPLSIKQVTWRKYHASSRTSSGYIKRKQKTIKIFHHKLVLFSRCLFGISETWVKIYHPVLRWNHLRTENKQKNNFVGWRTGVGPWKTTGFIYPLPVAYMYILPWVLPSTTEMLLHALSIYVSFLELDQVLREERL